MGCIKMGSTTLVEKSLEGSPKTSLTEIITSEYDLFVYECCQL